MKRIILASFLLLAIVSIGFTDPQEPEWGATQEQVKQMEEGVFEEGIDDGLPYLTYRYPGSTVTYEFDQDGRLYRTSHRITPNESDRLSRYRQVRKTFIDEYGEPNIEVFTSASSRVEWETGHTSVRLSVQFSEPSFEIVYSNTPMSEGVSRFRLLRWCDELEKERMGRLRNLELISLTSE